MFDGTKLKQKREEFGMKQSEIARLLDINRSSYFSWENGRAVPNKANLKKIAEILGVTKEFFYEEEIAMLYKQLKPTNQTKAMNYVKDLVILFPCLPTLIVSMKAFQLVLVPLSMIIRALIRFTLIRNWLMILLPGFQGIQWSLPIITDPLLLFVKQALIMMEQFMR